MASWSNISLQCETKYCSRTVKTSAVGYSIRRTSSITIVKRKLLSYPKNINKEEKDNLRKKKTFYFENCTVSSFRKSFHNNLIPIQTRLCAYWSTANQDKQLNNIRFLLISNSMMVQKLRIYETLALRLIFFFHN